MSKNTYCDVKVFIDDVEIPYITSASVVFSGNSKLNYLNVKFSIVDIEAYSLYNKKITFYLNESGPETTPYFTGYIMDVSPTSTSCSVKAIDPRCFLTGKESKKISITDDKNYDGYTIVQFIKDLVDETLGEKGFPKNSLGTELLKETKKPIIMRGERHESSAIYDIIKNKIEKSTSDEDLEDIYGYFIDVVETEMGPQIVIKEDNSLNLKPNIYLSYNDGIQSVTYNKRAIPSYGIARASEGIVGEFQDGNMPLGYRAVEITGDFKDPDTAKYKALTEVYKNKESMEIKVQANKGFKTPLGSIVYIDVDDLNIKGNHRLISKRCNWSSGSVKLSLSLGRVAPEMKNFI